MYIKKTHIIKYAVEEKGFDPEYKYNELKLHEYNDGSLILCHSDSNHEGSIFFYPSQVKELKKVLDKLGGNND